MREQQPRLVNDWSVEFHGKAETVGDVWFYEQDGKRYPLRPMNPTTEGDCDGT